MEKNASFPWSIFIPGAPLVGEGDPEGLPELSSDADTNKMAWNTIGNTASISAALIALKLIANRTAKKELEKARKRVHENKVNAMFAYSTPNTAPQADAVEKVRSLGVTKKASTLEKEASPWTTALPIVLSVPAALAISKIVEDKAKDEEQDEADQKLAEARNKLDALHARLLKLRMKKSASLGMPEMDDESEEVGVDSEEDNEEEKERNKATNQRYARQLKNEISQLEAQSTDQKLTKKAGASIWDFLGGSAILIAALTAGLSGATVYHLTKSKDSERKRKKLLEKQIFAQNLTNTPNQVELLLGKHNPFPTDESRQNYIQEISKAID